MSLNSSDINALLRQIMSTDAFKHSSLCIDNSVKPSFDSSTKGRLIYRWDSLGLNETGRLTFLFKDYDEKIVVASIMAYENNIISELELWRGDGEEIVKIPAYSELIEGKAGEQYK